MKSVFTDSSIVIVANDLNLSIFKPLWLVKNKILLEEEIQGDMVFSPVTVQIPTDRFIFSVLPNRVQMSIPRHINNAYPDIKRVLEGVINTLPHTPYTAVGLNFHYMIDCENQTKFYTWDKKLFASELAKKVVPADNGNARFGSYFSFDVLEARLKINITPTKANENIKELCESWQKDQELIKVDFNLHHSVQDDSATVNTVINTLEKWNEILSLTQEITKMISD